MATRRGREQRCWWRLGRSRRDALSQDSVLGKWFNSWGQTRNVSVTQIGDWQMGGSWRAPTLKQITWHQTRRHLYLMSCSGLPQLWPVYWSKAEAEHHAMSCMVLQVELQIGLWDAWNAVCCFGGVTPGSVSVSLQQLEHQWSMKVKGFHFQLTSRLFVAPRWDRTAVSASL